MKFRKITLALAAVAAMSAMSAHAVNLVVNGGFETTTNGKGQLRFNTDATGCTNALGYTSCSRPAVPTPAVRPDSTASCRFGALATARPTAWR